MRRRSPIGSKLHRRREHERLAISDVILGRLSHVPIVTIAMPMLDATGAVTGVVGGSLDLSKFEQFVEDFRTLPDAHITIVDQHDRLIYASGQTGFAALESLAQDELVLSAARAGNGVFRYQRQMENASGRRGSPRPR